MNKLTILGSGTFFIDKKVTASAFLLEADGKKILIDCGPGTLVKLAQAGVSIMDLDYVFLTHYHADHTSDLFPLFMNFRLAEIFDPMPPKKFPVFYGPEELEKFMLNHSILIEMESVKDWGKIKFKEHKPRTKLGNLVIKTFKVEHEIFNVKARGYALRFELDNKVLALSGDTVDCPGVRKACQNADLFLCDTSFPKGMVNKAHMTADEVGKIASDSKVKSMLLYHLYPQFEHTNLVGEIKKFYNGPVRKVKDLETVKI